MAVKKYLAKSLVYYITVFILPKSQPEISKLFLKASYSKSFCLISHLVSVFTIAVR